MCNQDQRRRGRKAYALHAPEIECIGKGEARAPYKGYRGHDHPHRFRVWISGQARRVTKPIRREMKRPAAIEPMIGHLKAEHRMGRNYHKGHAGDCANALLAAAGYNFGLLLRWLAEILRALFAVLLHSAPMPRFAQISAPPGSSCIVATPVKRRESANSLTSPG